MRPKLFPKIQSKVFLKTVFLFSTVVLSIVRPNGGRISSCWELVFASRECKKVTADQNFSENSFNHVVHYRAQFIDSLRNF